MAAPMKMATATSTTSRRHGELGGDDVVAME
ncbi:hypothetical protein HU200_060378 [Digitaria exilis]|uniref:Uncharacterized protein n=1 Tax=Digitaria exilis TaxID=1010633 RepID=A0A835AAC6_9POAL|nr:hypothetical protein HU200_060378 [Digitaria exilis]